jgi:peptidoglycan/LPS O-acetylase OafA/YrhL
MLDESPTKLEDVWMDMVRGVAIIAIVIHHWLLFLHNPYIISFFDVLAEFIHNVAGTFVHLFFILSGCGLTVSYFKKGEPNWKQWGMKRFEKIVLPYWIIIFLTFIFINLIHHVLPTFNTFEYSWTTLLTYLSFTRNFYSPSWGLNPTLWFMPVIIGLYIIFPILMNILKKHGVIFLLLFSFLITYASITVSLLIGYPLDHQRAIFLYFIIEFSLGMVLGYILNSMPQYFRYLLGLKPFFLGLFFFIVSYALREFWSLGSHYKGVLTAFGIFLITLQLCEWIKILSPSRSLEILKHFSKVSYPMYLIHGPIIIFLVKPFINDLMRRAIHALTLIIIGCAFCILMFGISTLISPPLNRLSSRILKFSKVQASEAHH